MGEDSLHSHVSFFFHDINKWVDSASLSKRSLHLWHSFGNLSINIKMRVNVVPMCGLLLKTFSKCQSIVILLATQCRRRLGIIFISLSAVDQQMMMLFTSQTKTWRKTHPELPKYNSLPLVLKNWSLSRNIFLQATNLDKYYLSIKCAAESVRLY